MPILARMQSSKKESIKWARRENGGVVGIWQWQIWYHFNRKHTLLIIGSCDKSLRLFGYNRRMVIPWSLYLDYKLVRSVSLNSQQSLWQRLCSTHSLIALTQFDPFPFQERPKTSVWEFPTATDLKWRNKWNKPCILPMNEMTYLMLCCVLVLVFGSLKYVIVYTQPLCRCSWSRTFLCCTPWNNLVT